MDNSITTKSFLLLKNNYKSISWAFFILVLSLSHIDTSDPLEEFFIPHSDKLVHIFLYTVFSFILLLENKKSKGIFIRLPFALFYGILMELFQHYLTTHRSMEIYDILANLSGIIIGMLFYKKISKKLKL